jgi:hypothetical protein
MSGPTDRTREWTEPAGALRSLLDRNVFTICVLAAGCVANAVFVRSTVASDSWYSVLGGRIIVHSGLPHSDTLTVMAHGHSWVDQQWLAHLAIYGIWTAGGWPLAGFATAALFFAAFAVTAIGARRLGASDRSVAVVLAAAYLTGLQNSVIRAQVWTYVLFAVVLALLLADDRRQNRRVWLVVPVLILWANLHGSVLVGAMLVALRGLALAFSGLRSRAPARSWLARSAALVVVPWLCVLASPYAAGLPGYYRGFAGNSTFAHAISEWAPSNVRGEPFFYALLLGGLWLAGRARMTLTPFAQAAFWACAIMGLLAVRNDVWYALAAAAVLPAALDRVWAPGRGQRRTGLNVALAVAGLAVGAIALATVASHGRAWWERHYPKQAVAAVATAARSDPSLKVFANEKFGDWLILRDPPLAGRVAYDARFELLTTKQFESVLRFRAESGPDWQQATQGYGLLVLDPSSDQGAIRFFMRQQGTKVLFRNRDVVVLRRA